MRCSLVLLLPENNRNKTENKNNEWGNPDTISLYHFSYQVQTRICQEPVNLYHTTSQIQITWNILEQELSTANKVGIIIFC